MVTRRVHNANVTWVPHVQLSWGGHLGTTKEVWTNGLRFAFQHPEFIPSPTAQQAYLDVLQAAVTQWMDSGPNPGPLGASLIAPDAQLTWVKANFIGANGLQANQNTNVKDFVPVTGRGSFVPFYQTWAITLRTDLKRGRSHSGRIYPPCVNAGIVPGTSLCAAGDGDKMTLAAQVLINSLNTNLSAAADSTSGAISILSPGNVEKATPPLAQKVTGIVVDLVPDVQHRRTRQLARVESAQKAIA